MLNRLKSLELLGFKTFASRAEFAFAGAVTAIVGPNGSGKSNIADAIRWVLGEQSYGLLRAKKTEDMIFAGSEHRSRSGMAQATITFDNNDGWLPIDFTEVAITRRAYRDGQNEYFINAQKVRLKDVSELLAQSGLSERTYTIIGQGLVDATLALKAEERRRLFEEAAGIGLHRSRREEAQKRLEVTRRNLERVEDILAELQPRLKSLEKQSKRVVEYEQVKADLNVLLRDWYGYHWHRAQRDLMDAQEANGRQESNLERARQAQSEMDQQNQVLRGQIHGQREIVNALHRQMADKHNERERISRELIVLEERNRSLTLQEQASRDELIRFGEDRDLQIERFEAIKLEVAQINAEQDEAKEHLAKARKALQDRQAERSVAEKALLDARQLQGSLTGKQAHLSARLAERKLQAERQQNLINETDRSLQTALKEMTAAEQRYQNSRKRQLELGASKHSAETALKAHLAQQATLETERKRVGDERSGLLTTQARLQAQIQVLEQAEKNLVGYASGARLLLQAVQQARLRGALGALSSRLEVPAEYEAAVAAVLGEYLDALVVRDVTGLEDSLSLLAGQAARGVILPLALLRSEQNNLPEAWREGLEGIIGNAALLINASADLKPALDLFLSNVFLVRNRDNVGPLMTRLVGYGGVWKVVTLKGEVYFSSGQVVAGLESKPGSLSRGREKRELMAILEETRHQLSIIEARFKEITIQINLLSAQESGLRKNLQQVVDAEKVAATALAQDELALEKLRRAAQWSKDQLTRLQNEKQQTEKDLVSLQTELTTMEAELSKARETLRQCNANLAFLSLDEQQNQVAHWSTRVAVAKQAADDAGKRMLDRQASLERLVRNGAALDRKVNELLELNQQGQKSREEAVLREKTADEDIEKLQEILGPAEEALSVVEAKQNSLQLQDSETRQALSLSEHHHAQAKILLARRQEALDSIRRRVEDDFGLVAFRYADAISGPTPLPLEGMVEQLPAIQEIPSDLEENIKRQRAQLRRIGPINPESQAEFVQVRDRFEFLTNQVADLKQAEINIHEVIAELDLLMEREFRRTFDLVAREFRGTFSRLFAGGSARLVLTTPENMTETGIEIEARLPGKREQGLALLSGGERSLTAAALVFALLKVSPTPFCLLDEVDAMLDEANVGRFRDLLRELSQNTQFVVVTHNRNTVQAADVIYGVTMGTDSASQVISLKLDEIESVVV